MIGPPLTHADVEIFEDSVVPRYLSYFGGLVTEMLLPFAPAQIAHLNCRTGYPDTLMAEKIPETMFVGIDASDAALEMARDGADLAAVVSFHGLLDTRAPAQPGAIRASGCTTARSTRNDEAPICV